MNPINLHKYLAVAPKNGKFHSIAIDGRGGSGKTSLLSYLQTLLPAFIAINGDDYFEPVVDQPAWGEFNDARFIKDVITPLKHGNSFTYRPYDWHATPPISERPTTINSGLILERCFSFDFELDWDIKIWIETPKDICLERGINRENMPRERAVNVWQNVWQPLEDEYIKQTNPAELADFVIDGTAHFPDQVQL